MTNTSGCFAFSDPKICIHTGIDDPEAGQLVIYPNPAREKVFIRFNSPESSDAMIAVYSTTGVLVHQQRLRMLPGALVEIPVSGWAGGLYQVLVRGDKITWKGEVVKF